MQGCDRINGGCSRIKRTDFVIFIPLNDSCSAQNVGNPNDTSAFIAPDGGDSDLTHACPFGMRSAPGKHPRRRTFVRGRQEKWQILGTKPKPNPPDFKIVSAREKFNRPRRIAAPKVCLYIPPPTTLKTIVPRCHSSIVCAAPLGNVLMFQKSNHRATMMLWI